MKNQCDGCMRGLPVENGIHREPTGGMGMGCTAHLYIEKTKLVALTFSARGRKGTVFAKVPYTADGRVSLSGDAFNRLCEKALGIPLERGTTVSYG